MVTISRPFRSASCNISSAVLNLVRNIAGVVGIAFFGTILSNLTKSNVLELGQNAVVHVSDPETLGMVQMLVILKAQVEAYGEVFLVASIVMSLGVVVALFLKSSEPRTEKIDPTPTVVH